MSKTSAFTVILATTALLLGCPKATGPASAFSSDVRFGQAPLTVHFTDQSDPNGSPITSWSWEFGDGATSTEQNPAHTYANKDTYTVALTVTNADGSDATLTSGYIIVGDMWAATFGGAGQDEGLAVVYTKDKQFVIAGSAESGEKGDLDVLLVKVDANGKEEWSHTFGGDGDDVAEAMVETSEGDLVIAGTTSSFGNGGDDVYLIRTNADGEEQWSETYGGGYDDWGHALQKTSDGGFIIAGETNSFGAEFGDAYLVKVKADGALEWSKMIKGPGIDSAHAVRQVSDGYILAGDTTPLGGASREMYVVKTDAQGNTLWDLTYGDFGDDRANAVVTTSDNGFLVLGAYDTTTLTGVDMVALKLDKDGNAAWSKKFGGTRGEEGFAILALGNDDFLLAGTAASYGAGGYDVYLVKIDSQGDTYWTRTIGGAEDDRAYAVASVPDDGGFVLAGMTESYGAGASDVYAIRCNADGYAPSAPEPSAQAGR